MRLFILVDMDYFFAACEELRHHEFRGKPFIVGTSPPSDKLRGVVQSANYEARRFGVRSGMPTIKAFELCRDLEYTGPDDSYYEAISERVMNLIRGYGFPMEIMSIDECVISLDERDYDYSLKLGSDIRARITSDIGLPSTVGISVSKIYAKMACDDAKPNGIKLVKLEEIGEFLIGKPVSKIPGVGPKTEAQLGSIGIETIGELSEANPMVLIERFGSFGTEMYRISKGLDRSGISDVQSVLSIGREATIKGEPTAERIAETLRSLVTNTIGELNKKSMLFKTVTVKVRYTDFTDRIRSRSLNNYTSSSDIVYSTSIKMINELIESKAPRKIGVRLSSLIEEGGQSKLFGRANGSAGNA